MGCRYCQWVVGIGVVKFVWFGVVYYFGLVGDGVDWQVVVQFFGYGCQICCDVVMFYGEQVFGVGKVCLYFICDQQYCILVVDFVQVLQEVGWGFVKVVFVLYGFDDDGGDLCWVDVGFEQLVQCGQCLILIDVV